MTKKEKASRAMTVMVQPSLFEAFENKCQEEHRNVSEVLRELISKYSKGWNQIPEFLRKSDE